MPSPPVEDVDLLVVGGGKAGKSLAVDRARAGQRVVMVERDKVGGTCINVACIPTKSLVESARTLLSARSAAEMGVQVDGEPDVSIELLRRHKEGVVGGMVSAHEELFAGSGMDFVIGTARVERGPRPRPPHRPRAGEQAAGPDARSGRCLAVGG